MATKRTMRTIFAGALTTGLLATAFVVPASADVPRNCQYDVRETGTTVTACADVDIDVIQRQGYLGGSVEGDISADVGVEDGYGEGEILTKPGVRDPLELGDYGARRSANVRRTGADVNETSIASDPAPIYYILGQPIYAYKHFMPQDDVTVYASGYTATCDLGRTGGPGDLTGVPGVDCTHDLPIAIDWGSTLDRLGWSTSKIFR